MKFRLRAFLFHCAVSACLALISIVVVFGVWYPSPLHVAAGVSVIFLVLLGVDIVIGPLLTLIVAKEGKKNLKWDLGIIVALQLGAFSYGMYAVANGRPIWLVFNVDRFDLVQAYELNHQYRERAPEKYRHLSLWGPDWVAARRPEKQEDRNTLLFDSLSLGIDLPQRPDLYVPYGEAAVLAGEKARPLSDLENFNWADDVTAVLSQWPEADSYLPIMAPAKPMTVLLSKKQNKVIAVVPLNPWD